MNGLPSLLPLLIVLACPLMMISMMKGMRGGGKDDQAMHDQHQKPVGPPPERIAELEGELARLKSEREHAPDFDKWEEGR